MNIRELTIGQAQEIAEMFSGKNTNGLNTDYYYLGKDVIVRTYSAGVWCGKVVAKNGAEIILSNARRMWLWQCRKSISLSGTVAYGIVPEESKICAPLNDVWLEAIEILPISGEPLKSIMEAPIVEAE